MRPTFRTTLHLAMSVVLATGCSGSANDEMSADSSATATDSSASTASTATSSTPTTAASLTAEDIDRWQKGMDGELEAVKKASEQLKAAKNGNDSLTAIASTNDMSTRDAGAQAAGVDGERYQLIRSTLSGVVGQMAPLENEMDVSKLPAAAVAELKKGREESLATATAELSPQLVEALKPRAAALRKQDLALIVERLKAAGMTR